MEFNLYDMCSDDNVVRIAMGDELRSKFNYSVSRLRLKRKFISDSFGFDYSSVCRWLKNHKFVPLKLFKLLKEVYFLDFSNHMKYFVGCSNSRKIKIPKKLNENLAKVIGAHVADGCLKKRVSQSKNGRYMRYELVLREQYYSHVDSFCRWFNDCFDYGIRPIDRGNHFEVYIGSRVIFEYFNKILKIPYGPKSATIRVPDYIKNSNYNIKVAFLMGIFMFDGSVERKTGYVSLVSRSEKLVKGLYKLLEDIGIVPDYINKKPDKYKRHRLIIRKQAKLKECLTLFEKDTEKWERLYKFLKLKHKL